ncbi:hypothetical protein ONV78_23000 [Hahella sp. CR1]|uniref:hypothetical protein n=1 Tax=Hahella sp. CR1 TaxID=2992807 RepID=UPI002443458B|nr:hypothetical protein [Hahella sp. CR1]MDG9670625.1 hypothetical protein [Hahella sp. CR1]
MSVLASEIKINKLRYIDTFQTVKGCFSGPPFSLDNTVKLNVESFEDSFFEFLSVTVGGGSLLHYDVKLHGKIAEDRSDLYIDEVGYIKFYVGTGASVFICPPDNSHSLESVLSNFECDKLICGDISLDGIVLSFRTVDRSKVSFDEKPYGFLVDFLECHDFFDKTVTHHC